MLCNTGWNWFFTTNWRAKSMAGVVKLALGLAFVSCQLAMAQTFQVIHNFAGPDGVSPFAGVTIDQGGNLYGTTQLGGAAGLGTVFELARAGADWAFTSLYSFSGESDGEMPFAGVTLAPDGSLYGTTRYGGMGCGIGDYPGCGTVYHLAPICRSLVCKQVLKQSWKETVIYRFTGGADGAKPSADVTFDSEGRLYGTAVSGGAGGWGTVFQLTQTNNVWSERTLYPFTDGSDGGNPTGGVIFDQAGRLYSTAGSGGAHFCGTVFQLTRSGSNWTESTLYAFQMRPDGCSPEGGLIFDSSGNLYGTTFEGGRSSAGTAFELSPVGQSWTEAVINDFSNNENSPDHPGISLVLDNNGNLYGTAHDGGTHNFGVVFKLSSSSNGWTYTSLHDFTGGSDGGHPFSNLVFDKAGNLYGTANSGGVHAQGVVFEITP